MHKIRLSTNSLGLLRVLMRISLFLTTSEAVPSTHDDTFPYCYVRPHTTAADRLTVKKRSIEWRTGPSWDHPSHQVAVCVGILPALCAILALLCVHGSQSIAKTAHPSDQVFEDTEC